MARILMAQTLGSALVPGCLVLSEAAGRLLDAFPSSATAWYLVLAVFAPLEQVRAVPSPLATVLDRAALTEFLIVLLLIGAVQTVRFRFGVAVLAHLAFAASLSVARAWVMDPHGSVAPGLLLVREASGTALVAILLTASGLACALSHVGFILAILRGQPRRGGTAPQVLWPVVGGPQGKRGTMNGFPPAMGLGV